jgi:cytochrome c553
MKRIVILVGCLLVFSAYAYAEGVSEGQKIASLRCATCHSLNGNQPIGQNPKLAGQNYDYLIKALKAYKLEDRLHGAMQAIAADLKDEDIEHVAKFYANEKCISAYTYAEGRVSEGQKIASLRCATCHSPTGSQPLDPEYPKLAGQNYKYLIKALKAYKLGDRLDKKMPGQASILTDQDMLDLSAFYAEQKCN